MNTLQDEGHAFHINGTVRRYRGSIAYASGDPIIFGLSWISTIRRF
jgi:hypothetical protein